MMKYVCSRGRLVAQDYNVTIRNAEPFQVAAYNPSIGYSSPEVLDFARSVDIDPYHQSVQVGKGSGVSEMSVREFKNKMGSSQGGYTLLAWSARTWR